jgi:hypothetical protein
MEERPRHGIRLLVALSFFAIVGGRAVKGIPPNDIDYFYHPYASVAGALLPAFVGSLSLYFWAVPKFLCRLANCPHCDSLNSSRAKVCPRCQRDIEMRPDWTLLKIQNDSSPPSNEQIIGAFGSLMQRNPPLPTRIEDVSVLPYPKDVILRALLEEMRGAHPKRMLDDMQVAALSLAQYQQGIGKVPVEMLGADLAKLPKTSDLDALRREARQLVGAADRFAGFDKLVKDDMRRIRSALQSIKS